MSEMENEVAALRAKVAELEAQLAARDAEIAQLKGEVKVEVEPVEKLEHSRARNARQEDC